MIRGERVHLRAIERTDIPTFLRWFNDAEVTQYLSMYLPMSETAEMRWYERQLDDSSNLVLCIETLDGIHIGNIGLHDIDTRARLAELGITIGEKAYWGQGYGRDAIRTLCRFAFHEMNLHRIYLRVISYNDRARRCYLAAGFTPEGTLREAHYSRGTYHDMHVLGLLRHEFDAQQAARTARHAPAEPPC